MRRLHGQGRHRAPGAQRLQDAPAGRRGPQRRYGHGHPEGRRVGSHARMDDPHGRHPLLHRLDDGPASLPDDRARLPKRDLQGDQSADSRSGRPPARRRDRLRGRWVERGGHLLPLHRRPRRGAHRLRGRRPRGGHARDGRDDQHGPRGNLPRHEELFLPRRIWPDRPRLQHIGRARLPGHRPRARLPARHRPRPVRARHRRGGGVRLRVHEPHGGHHPRHRKRPCRGLCHEARAHDGQGPGYRDHHFGPRQ